MNTLAEILLLRGGLALDAIGVLGLGLFAFAALRLGSRHHSWGGNLMAAGAVALIAGRMFSIVAPHVLTPPVLASLGRTFISIHTSIPVVLLTAGLAGIVWGLWGHERWMREGR